MASEVCSENELVFAIKRGMCILVNGLRHQKQFCSNSRADAIAIAASKYVLSTLPRLMKACASGLGSPRECNVAEEAWWGVRSIRHDLTRPENWYILNLTASGRSRKVRGAIV